MTTVVRFIISASISFLLGCHGTSDLPRQKIALFKDKAGIYIYDFETKAESHVYVARNNEIFLNEPIQLRNDTLVFAVRGELKVSTQNNGVEQYTKKYFSLALSNNRYFLDKTIDYYIEDGEIKIQTTEYSASGSIVSKTDSITKFRSASYTSTNVVYNEEAERFYSQSIAVKGKSAFSKRGSIYLATNKDTTLLVSYSGHFDPKFGSGYFEPQMAHSGKFLLYRYLPSFKLINFNDKPALYRTDLISKANQKIKKGIFANPTISNDDQFLLFTRNERQAEEDTWTSEIVVLDLKSLREEHVGQASFAFWLE